MLRLWAIVFVSNICGALVFALLAIRTPALNPGYQQELMGLGMSAVGRFDRRGVLERDHRRVADRAGGVDGECQPLDDRAGGDRVAGDVHRRHRPLRALYRDQRGDFGGVVGGLAPVGLYLHWIAFAAMGNIVGGVMIVSLLNYGQVKAGETD